MLGWIAATTHFPVIYWSCLFRVMRTSDRSASGRAEFRLPPGSDDDGWTGNRDRATRWPTLYIL